MYEPIRARLQAAVAAATADASAATASATAATQARDAALATVATSQANLAAATAAVIAAQPDVTAAAAAQHQAQTALAGAQADYDEWNNDRPEPPQHPSAGYFKRLAELRAAVEQAQHALTTAAAVTSAAQARLTAATAAANERQHDVDVVTANSSATETALATAQAAEQAFTAALTTAQGDLAAIDARVAALAAAHTFADFDTFANQEQVEVAALRQQRAATRAQRFAVIETRERLLADHDASIEAIAARAIAMRGWTNTAFPDLPQVAGLLDALVQAARDQAAATPRTDDLAATTSSVRAAFDRFQATLTTAGAARDQAAAALDAAIAQVQGVNSEAP